MFRRVVSIGLVSIAFWGSVLYGQQPAAVIGMPLRATRVLQSAGGNEIIEVDYGEGEVRPQAGAAVQLGPDGVNSSPSATPKLVDLVTSQPLSRRASDIVRGKLLGPHQLQNANIGLASAGPSSPVSPIAAPPKLAVPGPESYAAYVAQAATRAVVRQAAQFRIDVTLGNWPAVAKVVSELPAEDAARIADFLLMSLTQPIIPAPVAVPNPLRPDQPPPASELPETQYLTSNDVLAIADLFPNEPNEMQIAQLGILLQQAQTQGFALDSFVAQLQAGTRWLGGESIENRIRASRLLAQIGLDQQAAKLLPAFEELDRTHAGLLKEFGDLAQKHFARERKQLHLQHAWDCYGAVLELPTASREDKSHALEQLIRLSPKVEKSISQAWLDAGLQSDPQRRGTILATLGARALAGPQENPSNPQERLEWLQLQRQVVEKVLEQTAEPPAALQAPLSLLGTAWLREAELSLNQAEMSMGNSYMQVDMYGNYYWVDPNQAARMAQQQGTAMPISLHELIECRPSDAWIAAVQPDLRLAFPKMLIRLHLRHDQEDQAFPWIEQVAAEEPAATQQLVDEFLQTWTRNHDPNSERRMQNRYIYFYGFEQKADSIPLTRSKQERNIAELSQWVERIRRLPLKELDETQLAAAFTTCHSSAEVFRLAAIEQVFGPIEQLKPETIASLAGTMRSNLATVWRSVREQEAKQTNRREPQIQQEVVRGYEVARRVVDRALQASPNHWQLLLAAACLAHDENDYQQSIQKSSEFSARREAVLQQFAAAAAQYAAVVPQLEAAKQTTDVYDYWFYASLGAVDLGRITAETVPAQKQFSLIRQAIDNLPGDLAADHLAKFANNLFTRMSPLKPELKYRYLKGGFEIVGDHPRAVEARKLFQYYNDLISEIQLLTQIDGSDVVGHTRPFGVYLSIRHTAEIERESAGFAKYVQNQNAMQFAYNYGRPTEDYRDKFEKNVQEAFSEHFEVMSIAFEDPKNMRSREDEQPGWRVTPYAYVVLQPLGPQVDKLPAVQLDLDFLDTSGFAVIPVHSAIVPIDATPERVPPRPFANLTVTQTLDERQAADGKLIVEIKGTAQGLVPNLDEIFDLRFQNFDVASVDEQPVLPSGFDPKAESIVINSDRAWTVALQPRDNAAPPREFSFAKPKIAELTSVLQRYEDADLVAAQPVVSLERTYRARTTSPWLWGALAAVLLGLFAVGWRWAAHRPTRKQTADQWSVPSELNPFTVLSLLQRIRDESPIGQQHRHDLDQSIADLEKYYFGPTNGQPTPDLQSIARNWATKVHQNRGLRGEA